MTSHRPIAKETTAATATDQVLVAVFVFLLSGLLWWQWGRSAEFATLFSVGPSTAFVYCQNSRSAAFRRLPQTIKPDAHCENGIATDRSRSAEERKVVPFRYFGHMYTSTGALLCALPLALSASPTTLEM